MEQLLSSIKISVNKNTYLKDPESSDLGKRIISASIDMIDKLGFEQFTFKKLGTEIKSPEASIYRYFENKHKLLLYLTSWYWAWKEYQLIFRTANIESAEDRLIRALNMLTENITEDSSFSHINEEKLHHIVIHESPKAYLTKDVDKENKKGVFLGYKRLVGRISDIILEINPDYKYPHMLISTVIEGTHHQRFFAEHLPRLTDIIKGEDAVSSFYQTMVFKAIKE